MKLTVAVSVDTLNRVRDLSPHLEWTSPYLTYLVKFNCKPCQWLSHYETLCAAFFYPQGDQHFNAIQVCPKCGTVGTVLILKTMGSPIREEGRVMPVLLVEVMGLELDVDSVDFDFLWCVQISPGKKDKYEPGDLFRLRDCSWVMRMDDPKLTEEKERPPAVVDVRVHFLTADE